MQRCAFCQGELDPATLICRACGRVQPPSDDDVTLPQGARDTFTRRCPSCNILLPASARFCGNCGQPLIQPFAGAAGNILHDTNSPPASKPRDEAITDVLAKPIKLADMPA